MLGAEGVGSRVGTVAGSVAAGVGGVVAAVGGATGGLVSATWSTEFEMSFSLDVESEDESLSSIGCAPGDGETQGTRTRSSLERNEGFGGRGVLEPLGLLAPLAVAGSREALSRRGGVGEDFCGAGGEPEGSSGLSPFLSF